MGLAYLTYSQGKILRYETQIPRGKRQRRCSNRAPSLAEHHHTAVAADVDTTYGASFPYTRYEAERGRLDRAHVVSLDERLTVDKMLDSTAIEAGNSPMLNSNARFFRELHC